MRERQRAANCRTNITSEVLLHWLFSSTQHLWQSRRRVANPPIKKRLPLNTLCFGNNQTKYKSKFFPLRSSPLESKRGKLLVKTVDRLQTRSKMTNAGKKVLGQTQKYFDKFTPQRQKSSLDVRKPQILFKNP